MESFFKKYKKHKDKLKEKIPSRGISPMLKESLDLPTLTKTPKLKPLKMRNSRHLKPPLRSRDSSNSRNQMNRNSDYHLRGSFRGSGRKLSQNRSRGNSPSYFQNSGSNLLSMLEEARRSNEQEIDRSRQYIRTLHARRNASLSRGKSSNNRRVDTEWRPERSYSGKRRQVRSEQGAKFVSKMRKFALSGEDVYGILSSGAKAELRIRMGSVLLGSDEMREARFEALVKLVVNGLFAVKFLNKFELKETPKELFVGCDNPSKIRPKNILKTQNFELFQIFNFFRIQENSVHRALLPASSA